MAESKNNRIKRHLRWPEKNGVCGSSQDVRQDMARRKSISLVALEKKKVLLKKTGVLRFGSGGKGKS